MSRRRPSSVPFISFDELRSLLGRRPFSPEIWSQILSDDCHLRIGSAPPSVGRMISLTRLSEFFDRTCQLGMHHWDPGIHCEAIYVECDLCLTKSDKPGAEIPCMLVFRPCDRPFQDIRIYFDPT